MMNYKTLLLTGAIAGLVFFGACKRKCQDPSLYSAFTGYDSSGLNTFIVRRYAKTADFSHLLQTNYSGISVNVPTTLDFGDGDTIAGSYAEYVNPEYDYEYYVPASGKTYRISEIGFNQEKGETTFMNKSEHCSNEVTYRLNGQWYLGRGLPQRVDHPGAVAIELQK